jgi:hypothetical protein
MLVISNKNMNFKLVCDFWLIILLIIIALNIIIFLVINVDQLLFIYLLWFLIT